MSEKRETKTIELSNCEVDVVEYLTWGENQKIEASMISEIDYSQDTKKIGFKEDLMIGPKYKLLELCVKEIREGETKKQFTREWMDNLSIDDGNLLYDTINEMTKPKKK